MIENAFTLARRYLERAGQDNVNLSKVEQELALRVIDGKEAPRICYRGTNAESLGTMHCLRGRVRTTSSPLNALNYPYDLESLNLMHCVLVIDLDKIIRNAEANRDANTIARISDSVMDVRLSEDAYIPIIGSDMGYARGQKIRPDAKYESMVGKAIYELVTGKKACSIS